MLRSPLHQRRVLEGRVGRDGERCPGRGGFHPAWLHTPFPSLTSRPLTMVMGTVAPRMSLRSVGYRTVIALFAIGCKVPRVFLLV